MCLILPTAENPISGYTIGRFHEQLMHEQIVEPDQPAPFRLTPCPTQYETTIRSVELRRHDSWIDWRHEFVIVTISYQGVTYMIHINRGWDASGSWQEYVPPITWGSHKPAEDEISIYFCGESEEAARVGTQQVAQIEFKPQSHVKLTKVTEPLATLKVEYPKYSLIGVNCWAWSRFVLFHFCLNSWDEVQHARIPSIVGSASLDDCYRFLTNGYWLNGPFAGFGRAISTRRQGSGSTSGWNLIAAAIQHGFRAAFHHISGFGVPYDDAYHHWHQEGHQMFRQSRSVHLNAAGAWDYRKRKECTTTGIPCSFTPLGFAVDGESDSYPNTLSSTGNFLYLLSSTLHPKPGHCIASIQVLVSAYHWSQVGVEERKSNGISLNPLTWLECSLVRQNSPQGELLRVGQKFRLPITHQHCGTSMHWGYFDGISELVRNFQDGDIIGIWAGGPLAKEIAGDWRMLVSNAEIFVKYERIFQESLLIVNPSPHNKLPLSPRPYLHLLAHAMRYCGYIGLGWERPTRSSRLEFGRFKSVEINATETTDAGGNNCTFTGLPHAFDSSGLSTELDTPMHSRTLCQPGDFLYLLTPPIRIAPDQHPSSLTIYTWSRDQGISRFPQDHGTYENSWTWFEAAIVRVSERGSLHIIGQRHEVSRNLHARSDRHYKHQRRLDGSHPLLLELADGDMIGIWARARYPGWVNFVQKAFVVVQIGRGRGLVGRYASLAYRHVWKHASNVKNVLRQKRALAESLLPNLSVRGPFTRIQKTRIEFDRVNILSTTTATESPHDDCLSSPSSSEQSRTSGQLPEPRDPPHLISYPVPLAPERRARSLTVSVLGDNEQGHAAFRTRLEVAIVRPNGESCELEAVEPGYWLELSTNSHYVCDCESHGHEDRYQFNGEHALVQGLRHGDMVGLWLHPRSSNLLNHIDQVSITIEEEERYGCFQLARLTYNRVFSISANICGKLPLEVRSPENYMYAAGVGVLLYGLYNRARL